MAHLLAAEDGMTIYVGCPDLLNGQTGNLVLADFYSAILGWDRYETYGDCFLTRSPKLRIGFNDSGWSDARPPRWPNPDFPQQAHLDIAVPDLDAAAEQVLTRGGTLLQSGTEYEIFSDPAGHPFCLYPDPSITEQQAAVKRLVYDCFSPRALAAFYEGFLGVTSRLEDSPDRVVIDLADSDLPNLAFQHAPPPQYRHPDPDYPAQLHVDYRFTVDYNTPHYKTAAGVAAMKRAEQLGAIHIPVRDTTYADPAGHPFCF